ncbi:class II fumarate hydratase [Bacteroidales bacterium OttesenSCG-928-C03]|nr:class II fumarate hydratase [Bacteroidales bacterium OttesenSCG-928-E04]MDL2309072.1 class II fumarate hydratase [Bacteroidales bacterium OttesenSCG-928-C03]
MNDNYRIEKDTLGEVKVPADKLWGAQTQRSLEHFKIGDRKMPSDIIKGLAIGKKAAAHTNHQLGTLPEEKREMIARCCDEIIRGELFEHFPLAIWQTGSGTQTNMNVNEVISNRAEMILKGKIETDNKFLSANDDVNKSQSTNDIFPTAMRIAVTEIIYRETIPALEHFIDTTARKVEAFEAIRKIGRTHLMDATPLTLGEEFSGYHSQLLHGLQSIINALPHLMELPIGGTAVGNGINTPEGYSRIAVNYINQFTGLSFSASENRFEAMASHDSFVEMSGALKRVAVSLMKIANDIRLLSSGPRCGLGEITIPANEPGSSIMPGKVNPTQCEALSMVCCQVIGNDAAITAGAMQGHLELNVFMPLIGHNLIQSARLLADAIGSFNNNCFAGIEPNYEQIDKHLHNSLMLVTALNPHIGYYNSAKIAQHAFANNLTLKQAALELEMMTEEEFEKWMEV